MTSLQSNWTEGLQDLNEKFELVKEVNLFAQNGLKKKKHALTNSVQPIMQLLSVTIPVGTKENIEFFTV